MESEQRVSSATVSNLQAIHCNNNLYPNKNHYRQRMHSNRNMTSNGDTTAPTVNAGSDLQKRVQRIQPRSHGETTEAGNTY